MFDTAMQSQGEVERKADRKKAKVADYVSKDPKLVVLTGVYHGEDGYAVATDTHVLVGSKKEFDNKQKGKIVGKDGKVIKDRKYPDYNKLKPKAENLHDSGIDTSDLRAFINGVKDRLKKEGRKPKEIEKVVIAVRSAEGLLFYGHISVLEPFVKFCDENGLKIKHVFREYNENKDFTNLLYAEGKDAFALTVGIGTGKPLIYEPDIESTYYKEGFQFAYDAMQKPRLEKAESKATEVSSTDALLRDALVYVMRESGIEVITDNKEAQRVLEEENESVRMQAKLDSLVKAVRTIHGWLSNNKRDKVFTIELPKATQEMIHKVMGRDFNSHNITANGIAHGLKNHGVNGLKLNKQSIPIRKEDAELIPYIMTAPDYVKKGSTDISGRESIRFYKELSNGYVVVVEKEYKNSLNDMETINIWAEMSSEATNALHKAVPDIHVQNAILSTDIAKIRKDAEDAIRRDNKLREQRVWHGTGSDFEAFDHSHMGEGEGQQVFGWGTYVTEVEGIGKSYAKNNPKIQLTLKGQPIVEMITLQDGRKVNSPERAAYDAIMREGTVSKAKKFISRIKDMAEEEVMRKHWDNVLNVLSNCKKSDFKQEAQRIIYSVEIPDDNGTNYLHWEKPLTKEQQGLIYKLLRDEKIILDLATADFWNGKSKVWNSGSELYNFLNDCFRDHETENDSQQQTSKFLSRAGFTGISYPAQYLSGGRKDGARNYVIFNENDAKIVDKVRFFRTANGEAYGFTVDGKIYLDPTIAGAETAIHEYTHLWATALKNANPKEWSNIVSLMKGTPLWDKVASEYPELTTDDELADEVLAHYSGKRGAEKLRKEAESIANGKGTLLDKAGAISALERVKEALTRFWKATADLLHIHFTTAEEVADKVLADLLNGVNPNEVAKEYRRKQKQLERINETNPMLDDYHVGIRGLSDILTMREAIEEARQEAEEGDYETLSAYPDITNEMLENALQSGK